MQAFTKMSLGKYLEGYNPNGTAICKKLEKCDDDQYLIGFRVNGIRFAKI